MKKILLCLLAVAMASLMLSVSAQSSPYDESVPAEITGSFSSLLKSTIKDSPPFPLPQGTSTDDIKIDSIFVCHFFTGDSIRKTHSFDNPDGDLSYLVTTTVKGTPYMEFYVAKNDQGALYIPTMGGGGSGDSSIDDIKAACKTDGNIPTNVIYSFSNMYLIAVTPGGQKLAYPLGEMDVGFIGARFVSLDRLRYDLELAGCYYEQTGHILPEISRVPAGFTIPADIPLPVDYNPASSSSPSAASQITEATSPRSQDAEMVILLCSAAIVLFCGTAVPIYRYIEKD